MPNPTPLCFDSPYQFNEWSKLARHSMNYGYSVNYCRDCTAIYQNQMKKEGRCQHKEVTFWYERMLYFIDGRIDDVEIEYRGVRKLPAYLQDGYRPHRLVSKPPPHQKYFKTLKEAEEDTQRLKDEYNQTPRDVSNGW